MRGVTAGVTAKPQPSFPGSSLNRLTTFLEINEEHDIALASPLNIDLLKTVTWLVFGHRVDYQNRRTLWNPNGDSLAVLHDRGDSLLFQPETLANSTQSSRS